MNGFKKLISVLLIGVIFLAFASCNNSNDSKSAGSNEDISSISFGENSNSGSLTSEQTSSNYSSETSQSSNSYVSSQSASVGNSQISSGTNSTQASNSASSDNPAKGLTIEKVEAQSTNKIVVTLNSELTKFDAGDLKLQAYTSDWYSLNPTLTNRVTVKKTETAVVGGKTVITYTINETLSDEGMLSDSYSAAPSLNETQKNTLITQATNVIDWQLDNGGWGKSNNGKSVDTTIPFTSYPSDYCWKVSNKFVGTIDNKATYTEMRILAKAYDASNDKKFKQSFDKAFEFIKKLQYSSGGFAQIYPHNKKYNDNVTLNDGAMGEVLLMLEEISNNRYPFQNITSAEQKQQSKEMFDKGIEYLVKAQIVVNGKKTAWCAQHDPTSYKPVGARAYELPSISGAESVLITKILMNQRDNPQAVAAAEAAMEWFDANKIENKSYSKKNPPKFFSDTPGSLIWYRFYNLDNGKGYFCTRSVKIYYNIDEFYQADLADTTGSKAGETDRSTGYDWAGNWAAKMLTTYKQYGYFADKIVVSVVANKSTSSLGSFSVGDKVSVA